MSQTAITPWEPSKYASRSRARNPFSPVPLLRDALRERLERRFDVHTGLRGREVERAVVCTCRLDHLVLANLELISKIDLVAEKLDRDFPGDAVHAFDPVVEVIEGLLPRDVTHRKDVAGSVEVRLLQQLTEAFLAHDVPDCHVDLQFPRTVLGPRGEFLLRDLRAQRLDVLVVKILQDESPDEGRLANGRLTHEADFHFHPLDFHGEPPNDAA